METFAQYLLKSVIWLTGFALVYFLFLQKERFFLLKRFYLLAGVLISFVFPLFTFHYQVEIAAPEMNYTGMTSSDPGIVATVLPVISEKPFDFRYILLLVYLSGTLILAFRAVRNTGALLKTIYRTKVDYRNRAKLIRTPEFASSFSFFNYVFINPSLDGKELDVILNHELVHVNQKHWLDLLLVEVLRLFQWINPFVWIYTRFIKQNHEYIADEVMLNQTSDPAVYKAVLVNQLFDSKVISLSNSFNYSLNKKRFDMMKKIVSSPYRKLKILFVLPVFAIVFYAFATPEYHYTGPSDNIINNDQASIIAAKVVKGKVTSEDGSPLFGVTIVVSGASGWGVLTNIGGEFTLSGATEFTDLVFSCKGYKTQILKPDFSSEMTVKMSTDPDYQKQIKITGFDGSQVNPLIVINGVISENGLEKIPPESILEITVLKDYKATIKYGEKGKNGVIEITTKNKASATDMTISQTPVLNQKTVKGKVLKEDGQPLESVNVMSAGKSGNASSTTTGKDGLFELNKVEPDASLLFSCPGYKGLVLKADFAKEMSVKMEKDPEYKVSAVKRPGPLVVIDGEITDKNYNEVYKELGYNIGIVKNLFGKDATDKYGDKWASGAIEITTRKKALEMGIKPEFFPRLAPEDYPTFQNQKWISFRDWVINQVKYPSEAKAKNIEGWLAVNFTVELDGTISNVVSRSSVDPILSDEVIRVIKSSPKWEPPKNPAVDMPFNSSVNVGFKLPDQIAKEEPFVVVEEMPMYPGGEGELLKFLAVNTQYPEAAKARKIEGKVIVRFIVNTEGNTEGISAIKGVHPLLDAEAIRVVSMMSGFKPGMQGGKAVPVWYMVPVNFTLPQTKQP